MKNILALIFIISTLSSCTENKEASIISPPDWTNRIAEVSNFTNYIQGESYLPIYSHIYHRYNDQIFDLTITVSIRNITKADTIYILKADYFNTKGDNIRQYINKAIYIKPMETIEIIIAEDDNEGGSGANFVFDWAIKNDKNPPLFDAVMISTYGQQGLSFSTRGVQILE